MLESVPHNIIETPEHTILCEVTHGINVLTIHIPLTCLDYGHCVTYEAIASFAKFDQVVKYMHQEYQASRSNDALKVSQQCKVVPNLIFLNTYKF